jgi:hypothetical protein
MLPIISLRVGNITPCTDKSYKYIVYSGFILPCYRYRLRR